MGELQVIPSNPFYKLQAKVDNLVWVQISYLGMTNWPIEVPNMNVLDATLNNL